MDRRPGPRQHRRMSDVFLTGATGLVGMSVLARLAEAGDRRRVWALVRADGEAQAAARLRAALERVVDDPDAALERVVAVPGDLTLPRLGLDARTRDELAERVTRVVHAAASVAFTLPLEQARAINVDGTRRVLELAESCAARGAGLACFAHVSTAYVAGTHRGAFTEDDHDVGQRFHNTYELTKWEAERLVRDRAERLRVQILRPSIVVGESRGGWTASFNVLYTPLRAFARGALPALPARAGAPADVVPVDYVADAIVALALGGAGASRTYHLTAGAAASTVGELVALSARRIGARPPVLLPPRLYRTALHPLLVRRSAGARRRWLERAPAFFPYFAVGARFDDRRARAALDPLGLAPPPLASYLDELLRFAFLSDWGRRPVSRPQARAGARPPGGPALEAGAVGPMAAVSPAVGLGLAP